MKTLTNKILIVVFIISGVALVSCDDEDVIYSPKPRGYSRINFPKKEYRIFDSVCPYTFEIPAYSRIAPAGYKNEESCNMNIEFPQFKAILYLGYRPVHHNIAQYLEDSHYFANKHQVKATGVDEIVVLRDSSKVYGLLFDIAGNTASSLQFYLTDSTTHFLHGSLYFSAAPNIDSLKIVVDFLKADVLHLINSARWKNSDQKITSVKN